MSVVVLLVLYAIAINSLMKGILVLWSVSLVAHRGVVLLYPCWQPKVCKQ